MKKRRSVYFSKQELLNAKEMETLIENKFHVKIDDLNKDAYAEIDKYGNFILYDKTQQGIITKYKDYSTNQQSKKWWRK